jgi:hypothetical protein
MNHTQSNSRGSIFLLKPDYKVAIEAHAWAKRRLLKWKDDYFGGAATVPTPEGGRDCYHFYFSQPQDATEFKLTFADSFLNDDEEAVTNEL